MNVVDLLLKLLSCKSLTPDDAGSLQFIEEYLEGFESIYVNKEGVKNLFLYKTFGDKKFGKEHMFVLQDM